MAFNSSEKYIPIQLPKGCKVSLNNLNGNNGISIFSGVVILASANPKIFSKFAVLQSVSPKNSIGIGLHIALGYNEFTS
jgi:hypothetical protein